MNSFKIHLSSIIFIVCIYSNDNSFSISHSGYLNAYAINRISDGSVIKVPFKMLTYNFNLYYKDFNFKTNFGLEHKIIDFDASLPLSDQFYNLLSTHNVDYTAKLRECYLSYFPSFGEIRIGKQLHTWGAVDINSPIDIINPLNYYYLFTDTDETKIGVLSAAMDIYLSSFKLGLVLIPEHDINLIPENDPNFPIALPIAPENYQFLEIDNPVQYGGYIQKSFENFDIATYYFSGYDHTFNLYGASLFFDQYNFNEVTDTIFTYRKTEMLAIAGTGFLGDLTIRADFAYFQSDDQNYDIESRPYTGQDTLINFIDFPNWEVSHHFDISAEYYQYNLQLEYPLPWNIDVTAQLFGYETIDITANLLPEFDITNYTLTLDDIFHPGLGASTAMLTKNAFLVNLNTFLFDDALEIQLSKLIDLDDDGSLNQLQFKYDITDDFRFTCLVFQGNGNKPDDLDTPDVDESLMYPFNDMDNFSHIRAQIQYFF